MEKKKWIMLLFLGLFILPLMISLVSAVDGQKGVIVSIVEAFFGPIGNFFENLIIAKLLLIALVAMLVYSIATFLPFIPADKEWVRWAISIVVAVLAFLFVPLEDIRALLVTYEAMGVMMTSVVPLVILIVFTFELRKKMEERGAEYTVYATWINRFLLVGFAIYVAVKWAGLSEKAGPAGAPTSLSTIYLITLLILVIWFFMEKRLYARVKKLMIAGEVEEAAELLVGDWTAQLERKADQLKTASPTVEVSTKRDMRILIEKIEKAGGKVSREMKKLTR
jgi:hypothetical protein